jgi:two-component system sensor kinase FixL
MTDQPTHFAGTPGFADGHLRPAVIEAMPDTAAQAINQRIFETSLDLILVVDRRGMFIRVSPSSLSILGYHPDELVGRLAAEILYPDDLENTRNEMRVARHGRQTRNFRCRYIHKDGRIVTLSWTGVWSEDEAQHFFIGRDLANMEEAERRFRLVVEAAPNAMVMVNPAGEIVLVNVQAERIFGYSRAELLGQPIEMLVPERFHGHHPELRTAFFADPRPRPMGAGRDLFGLRKDGSEFPIEIGLNPIETDEGLMVLSAIVDITQRKAAEQALRDREHRLRSLAAIVESSDDAIISSRLDGIVTSWNKAAERIFGWAAAEIIGQSILRLGVSGGDDILEILDRIKRGDRVDRYETMRRHKDGTTLHVSLSVSPIYHTDGQLIGASKVAHDITAAKRAEAALEEARNQLQELNAEVLHLSRLSSMGQMAAMVAHELNQPLTAISNYMEAADTLLERGGDLPLPRIRNVIGRAGEQAVRAGQITQRLRGFASRGDSEKRIEAVSPLVREAAELAVVGTKDRGTSIRSEDNSGNATIVADKIQIQQVLLNLLRNAVEAVADQDNRDIALHTEANDDIVQFSVIDNGPGLPEEVQAKLFQPFVSTKNTGMGVGLSICHTIIAAHDGRLWAEPNPEGGTIFRISLTTAPPAGWIDA